MTPVGPGEPELPPPGLPTLGARPSRPLPLVPGSGSEAQPLPPARLPVLVRVVDDRGAPVSGVELMLRTRVQGSHGWSSPSSTRSTSDEEGNALWRDYPGIPWAVDVWIAPSGHVQDRGASLRLRGPNSSESIGFLGEGEPPVMVVPRRGRLVVKTSDLHRGGQLDRLELLSVEGESPTSYAVNRPRWLDGGEIGWEVDPGTCVLITYWSADSGYFCDEQRVVVSSGQESVVHLHPRAGTGVIQGTVVDTAGAPVGGLPVQVDVMRAPDLPVGLAAREHRTVRTVVSDAAGRWRLEQLPPGRAYVMPLVGEHAERYLATSGTVSVQPELGEGGPDDPPQAPVSVELVVQPGYRVAGRVEGPWRDAWLAGRLELVVQPETGGAGDGSVSDWTLGLRPRLGADGSFLIERCKAGSFVVRIAGLSPPPAQAVPGLERPSAEVARGAEPWRHARASFSVDPSLREGALLHPVVILDP